jgi:hypothetical protein
MTATNHVLTGSVFVAATVGHVPLWLILPVVFLLHFVLDGLPHFGQIDDRSAALGRLKWFLPIDASVAAAVLTAILIAKPEHWLVIILGGILCASPDLWLVTLFTRYLRSGDTTGGKDWFSRFHSKIQWGERLWGAWIELAWAIAFGFVLLAQL